jgi:4-hydroxy-4-methyl-2-oxoglutarate aldolase
LEGAINVPVTVGGQVIKPGDAIIADESGVVILAPSQARAAVEKALGMQENEIVLLERLRNGEFLPDISGATKIVEGQKRQVA